MARARMTSKGQITVPKEVRERLGLEPGDALDFSFEGDRLEVRPLRRRRLEEFRGIFRVPRTPSFSEERAHAWAARGQQLAEGERTPDA